MTLLSLFDRSGVFARPWVEAGYTAICVDIGAENRSEGNCHYVQADLLDESFQRILSMLKVDFVAAFPPCTHLAVSGARWFRGKGLRKFSEAIHLVAVAAEICEALGAPYFIENPVSTLSTYWRKPDHTFSPCDYAGLEPDDNYEKKTCLWTGNGFKMPPAIPLAGGDAPDKRIHTAPPGPDRAEFRSRTPLGFSVGVFNANRESYEGVKN